MRETLTQACVVCGGVERAPVLVLDRWDVVRCTGCGMHALSPEPDAVQMEEFDDGSGYEGALALRGDILAGHGRSLAALERIVRPGRLLDVGCGPGMLLEAARARGWDAEGVDPSPWSVARARELDFTAYEGMLEDLALPDASYDAVALLQVVEHLPDPRGLLAMCRRLLRPGGAIVVATPNPRSALARVTRERFNYWIPPMHCVWYTPSALGRLLEQNGFRVARRTTWSARAAGLHDGVAVLEATKLGAKLPYRLKRALGTAVAKASDTVKRGTIVELIAIKAER